VIETLTTDGMIPSRINSLPTEEVSNLVDTSSDGGLLILEGIIRLVVSVFITESIPLMVDY
jgi:hypothetical protein